MSDTMSTMRIPSQTSKLAPPIPKLLHYFHQEISATARSYFAWKFIGNFAAADPQIRDLLYRRAGFWALTRHGLYITFLISLGRLFDSARKTFSVNFFLAACLRQVPEFSRDSLRARRVAQNLGQEPEGLDEFLRNRYEVTADDILQLSAEADSWHSIFRQRYAPIRNKAVAHRDLQVLGKTDSLFAATNIGEIEEMLRFLRFCWHFVNELYANGRLITRPECDLWTWHDRDESESEIRSLLNDLKSGKA